jgi:hypothetical protein
VEREKFIAGSFRWIFELSDLMEMEVFGEKKSVDYNRE